MTFDLTIRGAGIFGLSIAWEAAARGASVQIIDPGGAGAGASGGVVGALQPHAPDRWSAKKQFQLDSLLMAESFWRTVDDTSGLASGYRRVGRIQPLMNARGMELAQKRGTDACLYWGTKASWSVTTEVTEWAPPSPTGAYVHDTLSAIIHPRRAMISLAAALGVRGVLISPVGEDQGAVVWATGWQGLRDLSTAFDQDHGGGEKGQAALVEHDASDQPQIYADGLHVIPHLDGTVAIGSTTERHFEDPKSTDAQLDDILERAFAAMPILQGAKVLTRWADLRPRSATRAPILGAWPGRPGHFIANGGFKIGFGMAPKIADVMCDLTLEQTDTIPDEFRFQVSPG